MFAWVNYYDGTGFCEKDDRGEIGQGVGWRDGVPCARQHDELAVQDFFRLNNLKFTPS